MKKKATKDFQFQQLNEFLSIRWGGLRKDRAWV